MREKYHRIRNSYLSRLSINHALVWWWWCFCAVWIAQIANIFIFIWTRWKQNQKKRQRHTHIHTHIIWFVVVDDGRRGVKAGKYSNNNTTKLSRNMKTWIIGMLFVDYDSDFARTLWLMFHSPFCSPCMYIYTNFQAKAPL